MSGQRRTALAILITVYTAGLAAPWLAPHGYARQFRESPSAAASRTFPLGTDALGRDLFARLLYGSRISLLLAPAAAAVSTLLAALLGGLAGYLGGVLEKLVLRAADLFLSLPWLFLLLAVRAMLPLNVAPIESLWITFLLLGVLGWAAPARLLSAAARSLRTGDFVLQARLYGCRSWRILARHIAPNLRPILLEQFWMAIPLFILSEANLGLLGLGVGEPLPSWGGLLRDLTDYPAVLAHPALAAPLVVLALVVGCFYAALPKQDFSR